MYKHWFRTDLETNEVTMVTSSYVRNTLEFQLAISTYEATRLMASATSSENNKITTKKCVFEFREE